MLFKIKLIFEVASYYTFVSEANQFLEKMTSKMRLRNSLFSSLKKRRLREILLISIAA